MEFEYFEIINSAIWTALSAAPFLKLSETTHKFKPLSIDSQTAKMLFNCNTPLDLDLDIE